MSVTVLLADDSILTRTAIANFLERDPEIHILAHAAYLAETMVLASTVCPQVIVLDVHMCRVDRVPSSLIKLTFADSKVIEVSFSNDDETKAIAASCGAITLLDKTKLADKLIPAIKL